MQTMKKTWKHVLFICILLAAIVMLFQWYSQSNSRRIEKQNLDYAINTAEQTGQQIEGEFTNALLRIRNYAYLLGTSQTEPEITAEILKQMTLNTAFNTIRYTTPQGITLTSDGEMIDSRDRFFYQNGMRGYSGFEVVRSRDNDRLMMVFYAPIMSDGEVLGIMLGLYFTDDYLQNILTVNFFGEPAEAFLCTRNGEIIAGSGGSAFDAPLPELLLEAGSIDADTAEEVRICLRSETEPVGLTCAPGSLTDNLCICPIQGSEYMLLQTFPKSVTQSMLRNANHTGMVLQGILILIFAAYILVLLLRAQRERLQMQQESQAHITGLQEKELLANRKERQYRIAIMSSAFSTFEFNLTRDLIENDIVRTENEAHDSLLARVGLQAPCRASECFEKWKVFVQDESIEDYESTVNLEYLKECFQAGKADVTVDYWSHGAAGRQMCVRQSFIMAQDERTKDIMVMVVSKDITAQVQKQREQTQALRDALMQAQRANSAKTVFLSNMSHDIRTPMNAIIGFTSIAISHIDNTIQVKDCLQKVLSSSNHLLSLINDILDMSRIESGKVQIKEQDCNISELTHNLMNIIQPQVKAKQLDLFIDSFDVTSEDVIADPLKLSQVFVNLLSNAVKYTPAGGSVSFLIRQEKNFHRGYGDFVFTVKDNGIGMSEDFAKHIFEPFERETSTTRSGIQGTGLGMSITKNIVEMMGGTITVKSEKGKGSEFQVKLSLKLQDSDRHAAEIKALEGLRVIVVDDDCDSCESVAEMLGRIGMRADWTVSGKEAIYKAKLAHTDGDPYHTFFIDWQMPDLSGIETCRRIRAVVGNDVPIIILTAYDWTDIEEEARAAGVTAFCAKPLFMSDLKATLLSANNLIEKVEAPSWTQSDFNGKRILVVEDNELNREIAQAILEETGFIVETAPDGTDAVAMVTNSEEHYYDAVLMDVQMPVMDGYEATRSIRSLSRQDVKDLPIIAMTANAMEEDKETALKNGMNAHIAKPIDIDLFLQVLGKYLH